MDIVSLPNEWRKRAKNQPVISSNDVDIKLTLIGCADELELAWHQASHDCKFEHGCRFCDWEQMHNDNYPKTNYE